MNEKNGWPDGWMDGQMDGPVGRLTDRWVGGCIRRKERRKQEIKDGRK